MDKKALLILMLEKLWADRLPAEWLLVLVRDQELKPEMIEALYKILLHALETVESDEAKVKLSKGADYLQHLMTLEEKSKEEDAAALSELEQMIAQM